MWFINEPNLYQRFVYQGHSQGVRSPKPILDRRPLFLRCRLEVPITLPAKRLVLMVAGRKRISHRCSASEYRRPATTATPDLELTSDAGMVVLYTRAAALAGSANRYQRCVCG